MDGPEPPFSALPPFGRTKSIFKRIEWLGVCFCEPRRLFVHFCLVCSRSESLCCFSGVLTLFCSSSACAAAAPKLRRGCPVDELQKLLVGAYSCCSHGYSHFLRSQGNFFVCWQRISVYAQTVTSRSFSARLLAMNSGTVPKRQRCEFSLTTRLLYEKRSTGLSESLFSLFFFKENSLVKARKCDRFALSCGIMSITVIVEADPEPQN